jgi:hypothetical protein
MMLAHKNQIIKHQKESKIGLFKVYTVCGLFSYIASFLCSTIQKNELDKTIRYFLNTPLHYQLLIDHELC